MTKSPRFRKTAITAARFLIKHNIAKLPLEPFSIIDHNSNWDHMTYKDFALLNDLTITQVIKEIGSIDGCAFYDADNDKYLILYNNNKAQIKTPRRITWTIMHEIGHIELGHLKETGEAMITRASLGQQKYEIFEAEAEFFASMVLAPIPVLDRLQVSTTKQIMNLCGLSKKAAENRFNQLNLRKRQKQTFMDERIIESHFHDFIYQKRCPRCGHGFIAEDAIYCPICKRKIIWGKGKMIYDGFDLDADGKALICPRCENEMISNEGPYCAICGAYLINKCADMMDSDNYRTWVEKEGCGMPAAGYARYCVHCGNPTEFYQYNLLKPWEEAKAAILEAKKEIAAINKKKLDLSDIEFKE